MRQTTRRIALFFCFTLSLTVLSNIVQAQTFTVLHTFAGGDGKFPHAPLTMDRAGNLYGTALGRRIERPRYSFQGAHVQSLRCFPEGFTQR